MAGDTNAETVREFFLSLPSSVYVVLGASTFLVMVVTSFVWLLRMKRKKRVEEKNEAERFVGPKPRFRKRDKMIFYGKKMLRKVRQFSQPRDEGYRKKLRKRQKVMFNFAKQFLHFGDDEPERQLKEPPPAFLEADVAEIEQQEPRLPPEVFYMFKSVRVFGHFEKPLFFELCKFIETMLVPANAHVFHPGQVDDSIYVVQSGKLGVFLVEKDGTELPMKEVETGESVYSVLTILDTLTGRTVKLPQVFCRALVDTQLLKLPGKAFQNVFEQHPDSMVRVVQMIMLRLQQVTFMALHNFLGLSYELIESGGGRRITVPASQVPQGSPIKSNSEGTREVIRKPAIKKMNIELSEGSSCTTKESSAPLDTAEAKLTSEKEGTTSQSTSSKAVPIKKPLTRSVSFTEPDHAPEVNIGRCKSMTYMSGLTLLDPFDQSEDFLASGADRRPSDFDAVCSRARVPSHPDSPTAKATFDFGGRTPDQSDAEDTSVITFESRLDFPMRPLSGDVTKKYLTIDPTTEDELLKAAAKEIAKCFQLSDEHLLDGILNVASIPAGTVLMKQGDQDCNLHFVMRGTLTVKQTSAFDEKEHTLYTAHPGEFVGVLSVMTGEPSFFTVEATNKCYVAIISKGNFYSIIRQRPSVVLYAAHSLITHLSPFLRQIDFALDWMHLEAGQALYRQGEPSGSIYIVLNGRLRSVVTLDEGKKELVSESGRGEIVGVVEVLTQSPRATTVHAIRDTELAVLPDALLNTIKRKFPQVVTRLIRLLGERLLGHYRRGAASRSETLLENHLPVDNQIFGGSNLGTVVVIPVSSNVPLANFTFELSLALNAIGPTLLLNSALVRQRLGNSALDNVNDFRMNSWLGQQEDLHRIVLYQADSFMSAWTKRCIRRADCILIVGVGDQSPTVGQLEMQLEACQVRSQKELILLHRDQETVNISGTVDWLNARGWISAHHHVRCPKKIFGRRLLCERFERNPASYQYPARNSDFSRLARRLTGTSIGLVLGGGGARGLAHVGVIKALDEAGIPIDMVGGTSMGSFVGAAYADDASIQRLCQRVREWSWDMTSIFKQILDLTYPFTSMFSGNGFNASLRSTFGEKQIEDLLLPYFCITTDITSSKMRIHTDGSLWRYVRASMSLSGYLPPLCDPKDGHLLLDGGYVNNLPADVMKKVGAQTIIAIDVGSEYSDSLVNYGDQLSGWWLLWNKWNPFAESLKIPDMAEIQSRLAYVSCVQQLSEVKESSYCEYVRPPIDRFKTLEFGRFNEIVDVGYQHGKALFKEWIKGRHMPDIFLEHPSRTHMYVTQTTTADKSRPHSHRGGPSFTDLAEKISRIEPPVHRQDWTSTHDLSEREDEDEYDEGKPMTFRPRTGSLADHEDLLLFKAEAAEDEHAQGMHGYPRSFSADEAGYDSDDVSIRRRISNLVRSTDN